tara:strand:+ start:15 stop:578 length:564 start_codon:yes stop_codon:yes gene_type:complete
MRIIGGKLKGKSISFLKSSTTRPLKDSVKESIFNIISHSYLLNINVEKSNVLDLYSGIGSFGLECISRGANKITFVEKDRNALEILKKNLLNLSINDKANIVMDKIIDFLKNKQSKKFNIIFFDPPFGENSYVEELKLIHKKKIYNKNHIIIIHRDRKKNDNLEKIINSLLVRNYGRSKIIFGRFLI